MKLNTLSGKALWFFYVTALVVALPCCQPEEDPGPQIVVETRQIEEIGPTHCVIHGEILETGPDGIEQHGFVWSENREPDLETGDVIHLGTTYGPVPFSATLRNLAANTVYYVKAFASGGSQTAYGMEQEFTTSAPGIPRLYSAQAYYITATTALSGGSILSDGGLDITARGVCWSTHPSPTLNDKYTLDGQGSGSFESELTGLLPYTVYFIRAYATNSLGTGYGENLGFITLWDNSPVYDVDGNAYATMQLGDQVWMAENLKAIHYPDGTPIDKVEAAEDWIKLDSDSEAYAFYENSDSAFTTYGVLYTWAAAMNGSQSSDEFPGDVQGVCPDGWHVPGESEWKQLEYDLGMEELEVRDDGWRSWFEGGMLKQAGTTLWLEPNLEATNESGFTALPGGFRNEAGVFSERSSFAGFWAATAYDGKAWMRGLHAAKGGILRERYPVKTGLSVRCVMDP